MSRWVSQLMTHQKCASAALKKRAAVTLQVPTTLWGAPYKQHPRPGIGTCMLNSI